MSETTINATVAPETNPTTTEPEKKVRLWRRMRKTGDDGLSFLGAAFEYGNLHMRFQVESSKRDLALREIEEERDFNKKLDKVLKEIPDQDVVKYSKETKRKVNALLSFI
jgi:hypothetical protein